MNNQLIPFDFGDSLVRSLLVDGSPWFVANDIAKILEYRDAYNMVRLFDDDEKGTHIVSTLGGDQEMAIINESGLYHAILKSRKPEARRFRKWVTAELLPELRQNGNYSLASRHDRLRLETEKQRLKTREAALDSLDRVSAERRQPVREALYTVLAQDFQALGITPPVLDEIGCTQPAAAGLLEDFWEAIDHLEAAGVIISHLADSTRMALNLPHLQGLAKAHGVELPPLPALRRHLRESQAPRFLAQTATHSVITGRTMKCWIFERQAILQ